MPKRLATLIKGIETLACFVAALVLAPGEAAGSPITTVELAFPFSYQYLQFGSELGSAQSSGEFSWPSEDSLTGPHGKFPIHGGGMIIQSGPLADIVPGGFESSYVYDGGGFLEVTFNLLLPDDSTHAGSFFAPLDGLTIRAANRPAEAGDVLMTLGAGLFDAQTAKLLGIKPETLPSDVALLADTFGYFDDPERQVAAYGFMDIQSEVPEPASALLTTVAALALGSRVRRRPV